VLGDDGDVLGRGDVKARHPILVGSLRAGVVDSDVAGEVGMSFFFPDYHQRRQQHHQHNLHLRTSGLSNCTWRQSEYSSCNRAISPIDLAAFTDQFG